MYVDDMISGGNNEAEAAHLKNNTKAIFQEGGFLLHKWYSDNPRLEELSVTQNYHKPNSN